jgi:glycosyltransferase involved in cell wall biosynthesis
MENKYFISIIILVHNAPKYVDITLNTLQKTVNVNYEIIVVDNNSELKTKKRLLHHHSKKHINKLLFLDENTLFAKGNNIGSKICHKESTHILLLNSDIKIIDSNWLNRLIEIHSTGVTSYGICINEPLRVDGYCFLIDKELYLCNGLDENHEWWWSVTKLQAILLKQGYPVVGIDNHDNCIYHYGGKSGKGFKDAKGLDIDSKELFQLFDTNPISVIDFGYKKQVSKFARYFYKIVDRINI